MDNSARRNGKKRTGSQVLGAVAVSEGLLSPSLWSHLQMPPQWCHSARRSVEKSSGISQGRTQFSSRKEEKVGSRRKRMKTRTQELFLSWINHPPKQLPRQFFLFILSWNGGENSIKCSSFAFNLKLKAQLVKKKEKSWKYTARTKFLKRLETRTVAHSLRDFRPAIVCAIAWVDSILCVCVCVCCTSCHWPVEEMSFLRFLQSAFVSLLIYIDSCLIQFNTAIYTGIKAPSLFLKKRLGLQSKYERSPFLLRFEIVHFLLLISGKKNNNGRERWGPIERTVK